MRICAIGAAALIALCVAGGAQAKGPNLARACGASGCTTVRGAGANILLDYAPGSSFPYWRAVTARGAQVFGKLTAGVRPFAAPHAWR
jgi:hypothetical protein